MNTISKFKDITVAIDPIHDIHIYHMNREYVIMEYNLNSSFKPNSEKGYLFRRVAEESFWVDGDSITYPGNLPNEVIKFVCKKVHEYDFVETSKLITNIITNKIFSDDNILEMVASRSILNFNINKINSHDTAYYDIMNFIRRNVNKFNISINIVKVINSFLKSSTSLRGTIEEYISNNLSTKNFDRFLDNKTIVVKCSKDIENDVQKLIVNYLKKNINVTNLYYLSSIKIISRRTTDNTSKFANIYDISIPVLNKYNLSRNNLLNAIKSHTKETVSLARNTLISSKFDITKDHLKYMKIDKIVLRCDNTLLVSISYKNDNMQVEA